MSSKLNSIKRLKYSIWSKNVKVLLIEATVMGKEISSDVTATLKEIMEHQIQKGHAYSTIYLTLDLEYTMLL